MIITILGSGTSQGMPVIACDCNVCASTEPKDNRLRSSIMLTIDKKNYVIDTGPDFRQQMLRENVQTLEAVIYTHEHKDHVAGMDDVRAFNFKQKRDMEIYCNQAVEKALKREFSYVFNDDPYPGIPRVNINSINLAPFSVGEIEFIPVEVMHYKMPVLGFRIGDFAYITDAKTIAEEEKKKLRGTKVLIVNALRMTEHISHFNLEQALSFIDEIKPEKAYLTHISHLLGEHEEVQKILPKNVELAYDGLKFNA
jgi:phosphoribosyl 1,2-cyclic phosphate phosphodiesterase|tara:strand:+ start:11921 stop:12682 length:762 start_codon:yes stop_codon:yes gene_type:complete